MLNCQRVRTVKWRMRSRTSPKPAPRCRNCAIVLRKLPLSLGPRSLLGVASDHIPTEWNATKYVYRLSIIDDHIIHSKYYIDDQYIK